MKLLKQTSTRLRTKDNKPFVDLFLGWVYQGVAYCVRVNPQFYRDYDKLMAVATEVPQGELPEKYL